ncbi:MAG: glycerol kinase GlpK [Chloroflexi bacterium]|nr:glycerol kinase GlpK [Chloroflexota bacterium]
MVKASYVLALDQGTTGSAVILFNHDGAAVATAEREIRQTYPRPGWVEHDPAEIFQSVLQTAREVLDAAGVAADQVAAIGITNQRETTVVWDRATGEPVHNAIVWQCRRTADLCEDLKRAGAEDLIRERSGLVVDAYFSGPKVRWILDHIPDGQARAEAGDLAFGTVDSWLVWQLTGGAAHVTDYSNASRTMLFNLHTLQWDPDLLRLLNVPPAMLPRVRPSSAVYGRTRSGLFAGAAIPIAGIAGDQQAALFGQGCHRPGMAKNTYGTGSFLLLNTGARPVRSSRGLLTTVAWGLGDRVEYALEGSIFITGAAVQWLRDGLGLIGTAAEVEALAGQVADTGGVYFVPAFVGLGAPYWDMYARGAIVGLTRGTTRAHLARATLEAIAYQTRDVLLAMQADAGLPLATLRVDGGGSVNRLLMQLQSDILGVPLEKPVVSETTALGAAYLAGLAVGYWADLADVARCWLLDRRYEPQMADPHREQLYAGWGRAVERARGWAGDSLP